MKAPGITPFGHLAGRCDIPVGIPGSPYIEPSVTGRGIKRALYRISEIDPRLRLLQYALMPDHLHLFISIEEQLDEHIGKFIARFKIMVNEMCGFPGIFEEGYNDQIITPKRDFDTIFRYIRENPYRLAVSIRNISTGFKTSQSQVYDSALTAILLYLRILSKNRL